MGLHRLRGFIGIIAALAITAGALVAAVARGDRGADTTIDEGM